MNTVIQNVNPIVQTRPSSLVKSTYGFISTQDVLNTFLSKGWVIDNSQVAKTKDVARQGYQKHIIRLSHPDYATIPGLSKDNTSKPQLCLLNSHDGSAALRMFYGVLRIACLNGIIAGTSLKDFRVVHNKNTIKNLETGIEYMTSNIQTLIDAVATLQQKQYTPAQQRELIKRLVDLRLQNVKNVTAVNYEGIIARRVQDKAQDAYTFFNVLQEYLVRGGIQYTYLKDVKDVNGQIVDSRLVTTTTKRLSSITSQLNINQSAFDAALLIAA